MASTSLLKMGLVTVLLSVVIQMIFVCCSETGTTVAILVTCGTLTLGVCTRKYVLAAKATENGTALFYSTVGGTSSENFTFHIPSHYLPTHECGRNYARCGILLIEKEDENLIILPSQGGFVKVTYRNGAPTYVFHPIERNCNPVNAFYNSLQERVLLQCLNITEPDGTLHVIELELNNNLSPRYSDPFRLEEPTGISEALYTECRVFFFEAGEYLGAPSCISGSLDPDTLFEMSNCTLVNQMDLVNGYIYAHCDSGETWEVNAESRREQKFHFPYYSCSESDYHVRIQGGNLTTGGASSVFPYVNLTFGACVGFGDKRAFWAQTEDGHLMSVALADSNYTISTLSRCSLNGTCLRPHIDSTRNVGVYFDPNINVAHVVNFTGPCGHESVDVPFGDPDLLQVGVVAGEEQCTCPFEPTTEPTTEPPTTSTTTPEVSSPANTSLEAAAIGGTLGLVGLLCCAILAIVIIVLCVCCCKKRKTTDSGQSSIDSFHLARNPSVETTPDRRSLSDAETSFDRSDASQPNGDPRGFYGLSLEVTETNIVSATGQPGHNNVECVGGENLVTLSPNQVAEKVHRKENDNNARRIVDNMNHTLNGGSTIRASVRCCKLL